MPNFFPPPSSTQTLSSTSFKTRLFNNIVSELTAALRIHTACGSRLGGVSLSFTGELNDEGYSVMECLGSSMELGEEELGLWHQVRFFLVFFGGGEISGWFFWLLLVVLWSEVEFRAESWCITASIWYFFQRGTVMFERCFLFSTITSPSSNLLQYQRFSFPFPFRLAPKTDPHLIWFGSWLIHIAFLMSNHFKKERRIASAAGSTQDGAHLEYVAGCIMNSVGLGWVCNLTMCCCSKEEKKGTIFFYDWRRLLNNNCWYDIHRRQDVNSWFSTPSNHSDNGTLFEQSRPNPNLF